jgi:hypothetical protein
MVPSWSSKSESASPLELPPTAFSSLPPSQRNVGKADDGAALGEFGLVIRAESSPRDGEHAAGAFELGELGELSDYRGSSFDEWALRELGELALLDLGELALLFGFMERAEGAARRADGAADDTAAVPNPSSSTVAALAALERRSASELSALPSPSAGRVRRATAASSPPPLALDFAPPEVRALLARNGVGRGGMGRDALGM